MGNALYDKAMLVLVYTLLPVTAVVGAVAWRATEPPPAPALAQTQIRTPSTPHVTVGPVEQVVEVPAVVTVAKKAAAPKPRRWTCEDHQTVLGFKYAENAPIEEADSAHVQVCHWE